jgi:hypothetical protein
VKFIIRSGKVKGEGQYWGHGDPADYWRPATRAQLANPVRFDTIEDAQDVFEEALVTDLHEYGVPPSGLRIVRLLSHAESKAKAVRRAIATAVADPSSVGDALVEWKVRQVCNLAKVPEVDADGAPLSTVRRLLHLMNNMDQQYRRWKAINALFELAEKAPNFATDSATWSGAQYEVTVQRLDGKRPIDMIEELKAELEKVTAERQNYALALCEEIVVDAEKGIEGPMERWVIEGMRRGIEARRS